MGGPGAERELGDLNAPLNMDWSIGIRERTSIPFLVIFLLLFSFLV